MQLKRPNSLLSPAIYSQSQPLSYPFKHTFLYALLHAVGVYSARIRHLRVCMACALRCYRVLACVVWVGWGWKERERCCSCVDCLCVCCRTQQGRMEEELVRLGKLLAGCLILVISCYFAKLVIRKQWPSNARWIHYLDILFYVLCWFASGGLIGMYLDLLCVWPGTRRLYCLRCSTSGFCLGIRTPFWPHLFTLASNGFWLDPVFTLGLFRSTHCLMGLLSGSKKSDSVFIKRMTCVCVSG